MITAIVTSITPATSHSRPHQICSPNLPFSRGFTIKTKTRSRRISRLKLAASASAAGSYASAIAEVAKSNGTLDATSTDIETIDKLFSDDSILNFFVSPIISLDQKRELIDDITSSGTLQPHVCNFLNVLIESKRIGLIKEIVKEFEIVYNKLTETEMAIVTSVVKLEKQHLAQIAKQVQKLSGARNVRIKTAIDESLVAGFTIRYGNGQSKLIDMSVKKQLDDIAAELLQVSSVV
ncbi:hypothetical protein QVD17_34804 [Tagetes erecta]|uniref:Uncharacterized protein n=1 Tax=Tagetes erecta TaxID=13708 RepID=A0AAD8NLE1_TARER|nr:hypothetical protein QVD17_34804 [Tagetes erecta]